MFLKSDLVDYVIRKGGRVLSSRRRELEVRLGSLRLISHFDRPFLDYWPTPRGRNFRVVDGKFVYEQVGSFRPSYMLKMSRVDLIWFAELNGLPQADVQVRVVHGNHVIETATGIKEVDEALKSAGPVLNSEGLELSIQIRQRGVRVGMNGGTWLGGTFGVRIAEAVAFTERLAEILETRYRSLDPKAWVIRFVNEDFMVRHAGKG